MSRESTSRVIEFTVLLGMAILIMAVILAIDMNSPVSYSIGALYCVVIIYSWLLPGRHTITLVAFICSGLILYAAIFHKAIDLHKEAAGINTVISIIVVWVCTTLVTIARRSFNAFEEVRENLETDVYERNLELENSRQKIQLITSGVRDFAIFSIDQAGKIDSWNLGAQLILGYSEEEVLGKSYTIFHSDSISKDLTNDSNSDLRMEGWFLDKEGTMFWGRQSQTPIKHGSGKPAGFTVVIEDLSDQRAKELELRNRELEQFSSMVAHDLKSPVNSIRGLVNILKLENGNDQDEKISVTLEQISNSSERMMETIQNLLQYAKLGSNKEYSEIDSNQLLEEIQTDLVSLIEETKSNVTVAPLPLIKGNLTEIRLLFQNLISNAIKFRKMDLIPEIKIWSTESDSEYTFYIQDNGIGIPEDQKEEIFSLFKRLHQDDTIEGSGVGLAHCMKIVKAHGGTISVDSQEGQGSTFSFSIPKHGIQ